jgi:hypothetical protein
VSVGRLPVYGSDEWHALDDSDPRKSAAVSLAAECWRRYWTPEWVAARTEQFEAEVAERLKAAAVAISTGADWVKVANAPSYAVLQRRRAEPGRAAREFAARHGGRYRGGPVDWVSGRPLIQKEAA